LSITGGGKEISTTQNEKDSSASLDRSLVAFQSSSFFIILSVAFVAFSPAPALVEKIGTDRATSILSILSAGAACAEIILSPALGSLLDVVGRKSALLCTLLLLTVANGAVSLKPSVFTICTSKFVGSLCVGLFFIASQAIVSDLSASSPELMSSTLSVQYSLIGAGFFIGAIAAGRLSELGLPISYGSSTIVSAFTVLLVYFGMKETLLPSKRIPFHPATFRKLLLQSPLSCTKILFRHSKKVRMLAIILMMQSLPQFMGDVFQIFAKAEWNLTTKDFSLIVGLFGFLNIFANIVAGKLVRKIGIRQYTTIATISAMLGPLGAMLFSFHGLIAGSIAGFIGFAQSLGVIAALVSEGTKTGVAQGELAGERSSFIALFKVIGPLLYSLIYVQGKKQLGFTSLPFLFNFILAVGAFAISQIYLS
jgi:MFS family permease